MEVLASRLLEREREAAHAKEAGLRKSLVGSGDRSGASAPTTTRRGG